MTLRRIRSNEVDAARASWCLCCAILLALGACANNLDEPLSERAASTVTYLAPSAGQVAITYDRNDPTRIEPFPDDYFLVSDPSQETGQRLAIAVPESSLGVRNLLEATVALTQALDGLSPLAPIVVPLPAELDPSSVPLRAQDSLEPSASIALIDLDHGQRVPFFASLHSGPEADGSISHTLLVFSAQPLRERGHYAFAITRAARTADGRNLGPSNYMQQLLSGTASTPGQARSA